LANLESNSNISEPSNQRSPFWWTSCCRS